LFSEHSPKTPQSLLQVSQLPAQVRESLADASLAALAAMKVTDKKDAIRVLKMLGEGLPDYLHLAIANKHSQLLRSEGDHDKSDILIEDILKRVPIIDIRTHCFYGRLQLSRTENAIIRKEYHKATSYLEQWEVKDEKHPSSYELKVVRMKLAVWGRVSCYWGDFEHAKVCLTNCLAPMRTETSPYPIMHRLADVYCELGEEVHVEALLLKEIKDLQDQGKRRSKAFRRLLLSLAEAYIKQRKFVEAREILFNLNDIFDEMKHHDISDQLGHVRSLLGSVRIFCEESQWSEALESSSRAFALTKKYRTFSEGNFYIGVILLFRAVIFHNLKWLKESHQAFMGAKTYDQGPWHFMPGIGTYVLHPLRSKLEALWSGRELFPPLDM
jgi:tetratricopeptide (TPR) repeat protein